MGNHVVFKSCGGILELQWGHGNPVQYSCLENPMDRGAWWAAIYEGAKEGRKDVVPAGISPVYPVKRVSGSGLPLDLELRTKMHLDTLNLTTLLPS